MKENKDTPKIKYERPNIIVYDLGHESVDFLTASGEDRNQGEWDPQYDNMDPNDWP